MLVALVDTGLRHVMSTLLNTTHDLIVTIIQFPVSVQTREI